MTTAPARPLTLLDQHGRTAHDLRISITDKCNLRCTYCMPAEGMAWLPTPDVLTDAEIVRLARIGVERLGVTAIRLTGGEPLVRPSIVSIVEQLAQLQTQEGTPLELSCTTNALTLPAFARPLADAGLQRVNVSLDAIDPEVYQAITRRNRLEQVLAGLEAARSAGLAPIKINAVAMHGINDSQIVPLLAFCLANAYNLRFIEHMPLGPPHTWQRVAMLTQADILAILSTRYELAQRPAVEREASPAALWDVLADKQAGGAGDAGLRAASLGTGGADLRAAGGAGLGVGDQAGGLSMAPAHGPLGTVGIIASVTQPFCQACDRTRLTADGQLRTCLFSQRETDLRALLRGGADDEQIAQVWADATWRKPRGHGIHDDGFEPPARTMSAIGG